MINAGGRSTGSQVGLSKHGKESTTTVPAGPRLKGQPPEQIHMAARKADRWTGTAGRHVPDAALQTGREVMEFSETIEPHTRMMKCP